jgi:WD40 repeat protein
MKGHSLAVLSVAFSPDGKRIASGSKDNTLRLWDGKSGEAIGEPLQGHSGTVMSVAFSPDGKRVVSGSADKTLRLWDAELSEATGEPLPSYFNHAKSIAFATDKKHIVSGSTDNTHRFSGISSDRAMFSDDSVLIKDGWMTTLSGDLLFWVPPSNRVGFLWPKTQSVLGAKPTRVAVRQFVCGSEWTKVKRKSD